MKRNSQPLITEEECCREKTVGGIRYINSGSINQATASRHECLSPCLFMMEGSPDRKFCFKVGDLEVECLDEEDPPAGPAAGPAGSVPDRIRFYEFGFFTIISNKT